MISPRLRTMRPVAVLMAIVWAGALCGALAACATAPPSPAVRRAGPAVVAMAPIPNPPEPAEAAKPQRPPQAIDHPAPAKPAPAKPAPAVAQPARDPAQAARLRVAGLEQLNSGAVSKALALLGKANQLDPDNVLIRRDLERAMRISRAVSAKP